MNMFVECNSKMSLWAERCQVPFQPITFIPLRYKNIWSYQLSNQVGDISGHDVSECLFDSKPLGGLCCDNITYLLLVDCGL